MKPLKADLPIHTLFTRDPENRRYTFWMAAVSRLERCHYNTPTLFCLGDSHVEVFNDLQATAPFPNLAIVAGQIRTATAAGLGRRDSLVRSGFFADSYLARIPRKAPLLLCFGEVDCNSRVPFRMQKYHTPAAYEIKAGIRGYARFIDRLMAQGRTQLIVYAPHPPCQRRDKPEKERRLWLTLAQRSRITAVFNQHLAEMCSSRGILFFSLESLLTDPKTGMAADIFLRKSKTNHHLEHKTLIPVLRRELGRTVLPGLSFC